MLFEEILDDYKKLVVNKTRKRKWSWVEKMLNGILMVMTIGVIVGTIWFGYTGNAVMEFIISGGFIVVAIGIIIVNEIQFHKALNERKKICNERLQKLKQMLYDRNWNSEEKIGILIEWSDSYSRRESPWIKEMAPLEKIIAIFVVPVVVFGFQDMYSKEGNNKIVLFLIALLTAILAGTFVYVIIPGVKDLLNSRRKLADDLKNDLKQLQLEQQLKR